MHMSSIVSASPVSAPWPGAQATFFDTKILQPHDTLFYEGDAADNLYEVLEGVVRSCKIFADGRRQVISFAFAGDLIGFGQGDVFGFDCDALSTVHVRVIPKSALLKTARERPEFGEKLLEVAANQVASIQSLSILLCRKSAIEKIASFLFDMAGRKPDVVEGAQISLPMNRSDIADFLGLTIETVSRTLTKLRMMNVIGLPNRGNFTVLNMGKLRLLAECEDSVFRN